MQKTSSNQMKLFFKPARAMTKCIVVSCLINWCIDEVLLFICNRVNDF